MTDMVATTREEWLAYLSYCLRTGRRHGLKYIDLHIAYVFVGGHFDYRSGRQHKHVAGSYLAKRADVSESSVDRFLGKVHKFGLAERIGGTERRLVAEGVNPNATKGKPTFLHQLRVPAWFAGSSVSTDG